MIAILGNWNPHLIGPLRNLIGPRLLKVATLTPQLVTAMSYEKDPLEDFKAVFGTQIGSYCHLYIIPSSKTDLL